MSIVASSGPSGSDLTSRSLVFDLRAVSRFGGVDGRVDEVEGVAERLVSWRMGVA